MVEFLPSPRGLVGRPGRLVVRIVNGWSDRATHIRLVVRVPSWIAITRVGCSPAAGRIQCELVPIAAGRTRVVAFRIVPSRSLRYQVSATVRAETDVQPARYSTRRPAARRPAFRWSIERISADRARVMRVSSWRPGCPVGLADLRAVSVSFVGFDGAAHRGTLILHRDVSEAIVGVMRTLYTAGFPIRRMTPVDAYGGDDFGSIEADNTSAFNCRPVAGTTHWSEHAYGRALDLNPLENPYVSGGRTSHPGSRRYLDRSAGLAGMIHAGDAVVRAFARAGWDWGGYWSGTRDYQHFSASGR